MDERFARAGVVARVELGHESDFALGLVQVRPSRREIVGEGLQEAVEPRVMQVLVALARAKGEIVTRDDLIESCWDGVVVGEDAINRCIGRLRKVAEASRNAFSIETIPRVGYRLKVAGIATPRTEPRPPSVPPRRAIYRGLQSLDEQDAEIFFGRDAPIAQGLEALRRMREGSAKSMLVILGASGAGKSSFLKAGLLARLKGDEQNFLALPVIRPERAALTGARGLAASLSCDPAGLNGPQDFADLFAGLRASAVERFQLTAEGAGHTRAARPPTIVIPIDQAEELFVAENTEAGRVLELLADAVRADSDTIIVATIRSDTFETLQSEPRLANVQLLPFSLAPLPHGAFKDVIEGPARLANPKLAIEPALTEQLLKDMAARDALPLLAFTLERLWLRHRGGGTLTLAEYIDDLGGLQGAITSAVEAALAEARLDPALSHDRLELERLARAAFIPSLVQLDDADGEPRRRVERLDALPRATLPLVRHLIDQRLLVVDWGTIEGIETDTVEVAHEAILRQWPALKSWIAEERDALRALDGVRTAAAEWRKHKVPENPGQDESWLTHKGARLEEAEAVMARPDFASALGFGEVEYLILCRTSENSERLREEKEITRTRRLQRNVGLLVAMAAGAVLLGAAGITQLLAGVAARTADTLASMAAKEADAGNYDRAARYAVAGLVSADWPLLNYQGGNIEAELRGAASSSRALAVLRGHGAAVNSVEFSADGQRIVTASGDGTARIWDARTSHVILVLRGHLGAVESAAFSPDGRHIVSASQDGTARIWDARTARQLAVLRGHDGVVASAAFSRDGTRIVTSSFDTTARVWDASSGRQLAVLRGHDGAVISAAFSPDGARIVTASQDKTARIWDTATARQIGVLRGHEGIVATAEFSPEGAHIVTASVDKTVRIWSASTAGEIAVLHVESPVDAAVFSPDGIRVATASEDNIARIWDASTAREIAELRGHDGSLATVAFNADGTRIVTGSIDRTARVWDASTLRGVTILNGHEYNVHSAAFSPDDARIVTASPDGTARIWDARAIREIVALRGHEGAVESAVFSPDGMRIATASDDRTARLWDAKTGREIAVLRGHQDIVDSAAFSPDGARIVTASNDKTARVWDTRMAQQIGVLRGHDAPVKSATFSPDGARIVTAAQDDTARIWDAKTARQIAVLHGDVYRAAFSSDGTRIITAAHDGTARIWDIKSLRVIAALRAPDSAPWSAAFSRDGERIVTASWDQTARIWDTRNASVIAVLRGHSGVVESAAFSRDGARLVTASDDRTARIWNVSGLIPVPRSELIRRICETTLANGLSRFSEQEIRAAPVLDPRLDADACRPSSFWARLGRIFFAALPL